MGISQIFGPKYPKIVSGRKSLINPSDSIIFGHLKDLDITQISILAVQRDAKNP